MNMLMEMMICSAIFNSQEKRQIHLLSYSLQIIRLTLIVLISAYLIQKENCKQPWQ